MELYYNVLSTYSQKVLLALYEKNVAFDKKVVQLMDPAGRAAYEAVYPIGKIPLLKPKADHMVPESTIIIEYLEGHHPGGTKLIPDGIDAARQARFMDRMSDFYLNDPVANLFFSGIKPEDKRDQDAIAKWKKHLTITYRHLNERLAKQPFMCGDAFTLADCATIPPLFYAQFLFAYAEHANVVAYYERAKQRASYKKVLEELLPAWEAMQKQTGKK